MNSSPQFLPSSSLSTSSAPFPYPVQKLDACLDRILSRDPFWVSTEHQISAPNQGNGLDMGLYSWFQTKPEIVIRVPVPPGTKTRDISCKMNRNHFKFSLKGQTPILNGELCHSIIVDDSFWSFEDQKSISIILTKQDQIEWWNCIVKDKQETDTQKVQRESSKKDDLDPETGATIEKLMLSESLPPNGKGKPTSMIVIQWPYTFFLLMKEYGQEMPDQIDKKYAVHFYQPCDQDTSRRAQEFVQKEMLPSKFKDWGIAQDMQRMWPYFGKRNDYDFYQHILNAHCMHTNLSAEEYFKQGLQAATKLHNGGFFPIANCSDSSFNGFRLPPGVYKKKNLEDAFNDVKMRIIVKEICGKHHIKEFKVCLDADLGAYPGKAKVHGVKDENTLIYLC